MRQQILPGIAGARCSGSIGVARPIAYVTLEGAGDHILEVFRAQEPPPTLQNTFDENEDCAVVPVIPYCSIGANRCHVSDLVLTCVPECPVTTKASLVFRPR